MSFVPRNLSDLPANKDLPAGRDGWSGFYAHVGKRALDVSLVLLASPLTIAVLICCAILIRREGGPVFFRQERVGRGGRVFKMLKLRTMVVDSDARLEQHLAENPAARQEWNVTQKLSDDPRVTKAGKVLRRVSFDELPQMWNVLIGDMSLVGPRPMTVEQGPLYPGTAYYALRPGVSGPWQVADRHKGAFAARAGYDAIYAREMSLKTDLHVLAQTVSVVLRCTGI